MTPPLRPEPRMARMRGVRAPHRRTAHTAHPPIRGCAVGGANPTPPAHRWVTLRWGRGGPPPAASPDSAAGPHHPSKPPLAAVTLSNENALSRFQECPARTRQPPSRSGPFSRRPRGLGGLSCGPSWWPSQLLTHRLASRSTNSCWSCPLGGVVRPRGVVRFARLIHRRVRVLGVPAARAASGGNKMPTASPHRVCGSVTAVLPPTFRNEPIRTQAPRLRYELRRPGARERSRLRLRREA
jgi:hypothetical protein